MKFLLDMNGAFLEDVLASPVTIELDETKTVTCKSFRKYAKWMMYPDPTYVESPQTTAALIAWLVNSGNVKIFDALRACSADYEYDEMGREYIVFPGPAEMLSLLKSKYPDLKKKLPSIVQVRQPDGIHSWGLEYNCGIYDMRENATSFVWTMQMRAKSGWSHQSGHDRYSEGGKYTGYQFFEYWGADAEQETFALGKKVCQEIGAFLLAPQSGTTAKFTASQRA